MQAVAIIGILAFIVWFGYKEDEKSRKEISEGIKHGRKPEDSDWSTWKVIGVTAVLIAGGLIAQRVLQG